MHTPPPPIVLAAYGTATRAGATYDKIATAMGRRFPGHEIHLSFASPKGRQAAAPPETVLANLRDRGHSRAVVQSLHLLCAAEFHRLVMASKTVGMDCAIGYPLLSSARDFEDVANVLAPDLAREKEEAVVLVGHGTDHPAGCAYPALAYLLEKRFGDGIFYGTVDKTPAAGDVLGEIQAGPWRQVKLVPLLLVAGTHVQRDLMQSPDSWRAVFEDAGIPASVVSRGLGELAGTIEIFCRHTADALARF